MASQLGRNTKITFPDLGDAAGASQVNTQQNTIAELSNDDNSRYRTASGVIDGVTTTFDHDFGVDFSELSFLLYTGTHPNLVRVASPSAAGWTIQANVTNPNEQVDVIAPSSGGPHTFALVILHTSGGTGGGSGTGEINYIENPDAEIDASSWNTFDDISALVDGSGGSPSITFTAQDTVALRDSQSFKLAKDAADRRYEGVSTDFAIAEQDQNKKLKIQFDFKTNEDAGYQSGWLKVAIYDIDNTQLITPVDTDIPRGVNIFQTSFNSTGSTNYRLIIWIDTADAATAWDAYVDNVIVGPGMTSQGAVVGSWTSYLPDTNFGNVTSTGYWRRVGDSMEVYIKNAYNGTSAVSRFEWDIPSGYTIDLTKTFNGEGNPVGTLAAINAGVSTYSGYAVHVLNANAVFATGTGAGTNVDSAYPFTFDNGDTSGLRFTVPISQWANQAIVPMLAEDNLSEWVDFTPTFDNDSGTPTVDFAQKRRLGSNLEMKIRISNANSNGSNYRLNLPDSLTPIADNPVSGVLFRSQITNVFEAKVATDNIEFLSGGAALGADYTFASETLEIDIKVPVIEYQGSQNSLVGYAQANGSNLGLVQSYSPNMQNATASKSANYTITGVDGLATILVTTGASNKTITLPTAASNNGRHLTIQKVDSGTGEVIIDGALSETINGSLTIDLINQWDLVTIMCDGINWYIVNDQRRIQTVLFTYSSATGLGSLAETSLTINTIEANTFTDGVYSGTNFTTPTDGIYEFHIKLTFSSATLDELLFGEIRYKVNTDSSVVVTVINSQVADLRNYSLIASFQLNLAANDTVAIRAKGQTTSGTWNLGGSGSITQITKYL